MTDGKEELLHSEEVDRVPSSPDVHSSRGRFLGSGAVYAGTMAAQRVVAFLLLPLYTRVLSPSEYGRLSIALAANAVATVLFAFGLELAVFRNAVHLADRPEERDRFIGSIWTFLFFGPLLFAAVIVLVMAPLLWTSSILSVGQLGLAMFSASLFVAGTTVPFALLRVDQRLREFVVLSAAGTATIVGLQVLLVVVLREGPTGWLIAVTLGSAVTLAVAMLIIPYRRPRPYDRDLVRSTLRQSVPVMPHFAAMWSLQLADRVLLAALVTTASVGVYSLASNIATPLFVLLIGLNQAFMPIYAQVGGPGSSVKLRSYIELQVTAIALLSLTWALLAPPVINVFLNARYHQASDITSWIVLGYAFVGLYAIPMSGVTLTHGKSERIWIVSIAAALVNLGLIYALVPGSGLEAAAIASAAGYLVLLAGVLLYSRATGTGLHYPVRPAVAIGALTCVAYLGGVLTTGAGDIEDIFLRSVWIAAAAAAAAAGLNRRRLAVIRGRLSRP